MSMRILAGVWLATIGGGCFSSSGGAGGTATFDAGEDVTLPDSGVDAVVDSGTVADSSTMTDSGTVVESGPVADSGASADAVAESGLLADADASTGPTCEAGVGAVDQSSLVFSGCIDTSAANLLGQTFTVGATGTLSGIELSIGVCGYAAPTGASYRLDVYDSTSALVASATLPGSVFGTACSPPQLSASSTGPGYFDLSAACLTVTAAQVFSFTVTPVGFPAGVCSMSTGNCTAGEIGNSCASVGNAACDFRSCVDYSTGATYAGGTATDNGTATTGDVDFKTFVQ
jgi:hypothetical protein